MIDSSLPVDGRVVSESFTEYLLELYQKGEIFPAAVVEKLIAEKDAALAAKDEKIAQLQKRVWELENTNLNFRL